MSNVKYEKLVSIIRILHKLYHEELQFCGKKDLEIK
jgi:hypothetical protein